MSDGGQITREEVTRLYLVELWTAEDIAKHFGFGKEYIRKLLISWGIPRRLSGRKETRESLRLVRLFQEWGPNQAYILGFTWADGNVRRASSGQYSWELTIRRSDESVLHEMRDFLGLKQTVRLTDEKARLTVSYPGFVKFLMEDRGILARKTSLDLSYPEYPADFRGSFLRGYFDGDGFVSFGGPDKGRSLGFLGSRFFLEGLRSELTLLGLPEKKISDYYSWSVLQYSSKRDLVRLADYMYSGGGISLARKRLKVEAWVEWALSTL